jgi:short-subunit dehydrogenase
MRIALRRKGVVVTTVCPGFVQTTMAGMNSATPFLMTADEAARRIALLIVRQRGGLRSFPLRMALLMYLIARLPDAVVARVVRADPGSEPHWAGGPGRESTASDGNG